MTRHVPDVCWPEGMTRHVPDVCWTADFRCRGPSRAPRETSRAPRETSRAPRENASNKARSWRRDTPACFLASGSPCNRIGVRLGIHKTTSGNANTPHQPPFLGVHLALKCSLSALWEFANAHSHQPCRVFWRLGTHATGERANTHPMGLRSLSGEHLGLKCSLRIPEKKIFFFFFPRTQSSDTDQGAGRSQEEDTKLVGTATRSTRPS